MSDPGAHAPSVAEALRQAAQERPDHPAVIDDDGELTLGELDALAATLAAALQEVLPPGHSGPVPLLGVQDRQSVVGFHGVARAGLTVAPLDPGLPAAAVRDLWLRLGGPPMVVVGEAGAADALTGAREVVVPRQVGADRVAPAAVSPDDPAVIIFTSGSSGRPKGVVVPWRALDVIRAGNLEYHQEIAAARIAFTGQMHWVGGVRFTASLPAGFTLLLTRHLLTDPDALVEWWNRLGATVVSATPSLAAALGRSVGADVRLDSVGCVSIGGEPLAWEQVRALRAVLPAHAWIRNIYGATETGGVIACGAWIGPDDKGRGPVPIGLPTPAVRVRTRPLPDSAGDLAEILVAGPIATGYLDDPALEETSFETDDEGTRWWRPGDLVRADPDGTLWAAGRSDDVVKINGVLVAPLGSEEVLRSIEGIRDVSVLAHPTARGPRLVAHLVVAPGASLSPDAVRAACAERLAPAQVPHVMMRHDALPALATGKVDRVALLAMPVRRWRVSAPRVSRSSLENWCLTTAREITGFDDLAPDDDLFLSGLDSLGVVDLCAAVEQAGLGRLEPDRVLDLRSVGALVGELGPRPPIDPSPVHALNRDGTRPPIVMVPPGGGTAIGYRYLADALGPDRPMAVVEARCLHARQRIPRTVERFAADAVGDVHDHLPDEGAVVIAGFSSGGPVAYEMAHRLAAERPVHLVLLDTGPSLAGIDGAALGGARGRETAPRHGPRRLVPPPLRNLRARARRRRAEWFARRPRFDVERYRAVLRVMQRAGARYAPPVATFPATLVHVGKHDFTQRCATWITDLTVQHVPGTHDTLLAPPHVAAVATTLAEVADRAAAVERH